MMKKSKVPMIHDPQIIPRVKQYLEENIHQTYVDVAIMARELQERYREYNRRKSIPFRQLVEQAYKTVLHSYGLDSNPSTDNDEEASSDLELMDEAHNQSNHMNDAITSMYINNKNKNVAQNDGELIDISSDESGDEGGKKTNNGNSTPNLKMGGVTITKVNPVQQKVANAPPPLAVNVPTKKVIASSVPSGTNSSHISKKRKYDFPLTDRPLNLANNNQQNAVGNTGSKSRKYKKEITPSSSVLSFKDVGGMEKILKELCELLLHVKHPEIYKHIGLPPPRGFLLHGPPGCGKTLLAKAIAGQLDVPLIQIVATELIAGVSGESEQRIREIFEQAAAIAPCVLFIDEVDAISTNRVNAQKDMERRIVTQLMSCLDNLSLQDKGDQVLVIGATNRADSLDPALRRVGRFDQEISLGIPDRESRSQILRIICENLKIQRPLNFDDLAVLTPGYVGADLLALATRAASTAVKRAFTKKEDEAMKRKFARLDNLNENVPIVNLTEDSVLMEVDDVSMNSTKPVEEIEEKKTSIDVDQDDIVVVDDKEVKESETVTVEKENGEKEAEEVVKEVVEKMVTETDEKPSEEENEKVPEEIEKVAEVVKDDKIVTDEKTEEVTENEEVQDEADKVIEELNKIVDDLETPDGIQEELKEIVDITPEEENTDSLSEAILKQPGMKLHLTLNEMMTWLSDKSPPISGQELSNLAITIDDFKEALKHVQPSAKREGFITVPDVTWDDIGSLRDIREELKLAILAPVKFPEKLKILGLQAPSGVLLCGPPGCGKTLLAKAVANEAGINFISVKGPELLNMYVGESERAVRQCFQRARNSAPCVIFFDEFDSLCPKRSDSGEGGASMRVVNQLLTEMDGIEGRLGVFLMAASNRPDMVDSAVLRPGRLDKILYVGLPKTEDRSDILKAQTKNGTMPAFADDVKLEELAELTEHFTGADLAGLVRQASLQALKDSVSNQMDNNSDTNENDDLRVTRQHFLNAIGQTKPSVSCEDQKHYEKLRLKYAAPNQLKF